MSRLLAFCALPAIKMSTTPEMGAIPSVSGLPPNTQAEITDNSNPTEVLAVWSRNEMVRVDLED